MGWDAYASKMNSNNQKETTEKRVTMKWVGPINGVCCLCGGFAAFSLDR